MNFPKIVKCAGFLLLLTEPAQAASAWAKRCEGGGTAQSCEMVQRLMDQQSQSRVMEMAIGFPQSDAAARGVLILPLGVDLSQSLSLRVDGQEPSGFKIRYCLSDGCYAFLTLPPDVMATMKKGTMATIDFRTFDGQPAKLPLSLEGFSSALADIQK